MARKPIVKKEPRLLFLLLLFTLVFLVIGARLVFIQVVQAKKYKNIALKEHVRRLELPPARGMIYDREGEEMAISVEMATVYATPYLIKDPRSVSAKLAPLLNMRKKRLLKKFGSDTGFVYLARKIDQKKAQKIQDLKIEGIGVVKESKRYYPIGSLAAQTLGFAGLDNKGLSGLELYYDKVLQGKPGQLIKEIDPLGRPIPGGVFKFSPSRSGKSVVLTLDRDIQYQAQQKLEKAVKDFGAKNGIAVVMNPKTGDIYALANAPSFNLNHFSQADEEILRNKAITDTFEPGSTMKVITAAAALEENIAQPQSPYYLPPRIRVADRVIKEAHERGGRTFTLSQIVSKSSNVGAVILGIKLGKNKLYKYIEAFGLTEQTKVDFPGEVKGYTPPPDKWSGSSIGNIPFGQGLSVTPLQMIMAISTVANDGISVRPRLVSRIIENDGETRVLKKDSGEKVISSQTAKEMRSILEKAVLEGTGKAAQVPGYRVAGKTGTAQKPKKNGVGYEPGKYAASFIGFAPLRDPQIAILVIIDEPEKGMYGGTLAAPAFKEIMQFSLHHLRIAPEK